MPIVGAIGGVMAGLGALGSLFGGIFGGGAKRDVGYAGAQLTEQAAGMTRQKTDEEFRRNELEIQQQAGRAFSQVGASGFATSKVGGDKVQNSMSTYANAFVAELQKEAMYSRNIGYQEARLQDQTADVQRQAADAGLTGDILGGVAGFTSGVGSMLKSFAG